MRLLLLLLLFAYSNAFGQVTNDSVDCNIFYAVDHFLLKESVGELASPDKDLNIGEVLKS